MYRRGDSPIVYIVFTIISLLIMIDTRILGAVVCIPVGALMLSRCHKETEEAAEKYDPVAMVGGIGLLFFGLCIIINYFFIK